SPGTTGSISPRRPIYACSPTPLAGSTKADPPGTRGWLGLPPESGGGQPVEKRPEGVRSGGLVQLDCVAPLGGLDGHLVPEAVESRPLRCEKGGQVEEACAIHEPAQLVGWACGQSRRVERCNQPDPGQPSAPLEEDPHEVSPEKPPR